MFKRVKSFSIITTAIVLGSLSFSSIDSIQNNIGKETRSQFIPNDATWYEGKTKTMTVDGYKDGPESEIVTVPDGYGGTTTISQNFPDFQFSSNNNKSFYPISTSEYYDWFINYNSDWLGLAGGGNSHSGNWKLQLSDYESTMENSMKYYIDEIRINEFDLNTDYGAIGGVGVPTIWDSYKKEKESVNVNNGTFYFKDNYFEEEASNTNDKSIILKPSYDPTNGKTNDGYVKIYEFNNKEMHENDGSSTTNPAIYYKWNAHTGDIDFQITDINDWVFAIAGGSFTFTTFINIDYDKHVVYDESNYNLANDEFGNKTNNISLYKQTQNNFNNMGHESFGGKEEKYNGLLQIIEGYDSGDGRFQPYFDSRLTYDGLGEFIINTDILVSRDKIKTSEGGIGIKFYDENGNEINKANYIDNPMINFKLVDKGIEDKITGETDIMTYEIPYLNATIKPSTKEEDGISEYNIYDFSSMLDEDDDPTDNQSNWNWTYDREYDHGKGIWKMESNIPIVLNEKGYKDLDAHGINRISWRDLNDPLNSDGYNSPENQLIEDFSHEQVLKNITENINYEINVATEGSNKGFTFLYSYEGVSDYQGVEIQGLDESGMPTSDNHIVKGYDDQKIALDLSNGKTSSDKILKGYVVDAPIRALPKYEDAKLTLNYYEDGKWKRNYTIFNKDYIDITTPGIYGIETYDQFGNASFKVIEYIDPNLTRDGVNSEQKSTIFDNKEKNYQEDLEVYKYQDYSDESKFDSYEPLEYRLIDQKSNSKGEDGLKDIEDTLNTSSNKIDETSLEEVTNKFETNVAFNEQIDIVTENGTISTSLKKELESNLEEQMQERGFDKGSYKIVWTNIKDNDLIESNAQELKYKIVPAGYWKSKGEYTGTITPYTYTDLSKFVFKKDKLAMITNKYDEQLISSTNKDSTISNITNDIEEEVKKELIGYGLDQDIVEDLITVDVTITDEEFSQQAKDTIEYGDWIKVEVGSYANPKDNTPTLKGSQIINFNSQTRIDISNFKIDENQLTSVTEGQFIGSQFNLIDDELREVIYDQLEPYGISSSEVTITFDKPEKSVLHSDEKIGYKIIPNSNKYSKELDGTFTSQPFTSLTKLRIKDLPLMEITNKYDSSSHFVEMKDELNSYLFDNLEERGLPREWIEINWEISDDTIVNFNTPISYTISPSQEVLNDETIKLDGEYEGDFQSASYYNLSEFKLDSSKIDSIMEPYLEKGYVMFDEIEPLLTQEVINELNDQGYQTFITDDQGIERQFIKIEWNRGLGERISLGQQLTYTISSDNVIIENNILIGEPQLETIQFGIKPDTSIHISIKMLIEILILLFAVMTILMFGLVIKQRIVNKKI